MLSAALQYNPVFRYPSPPLFAKGVEYGDDFTRSTLLPTGAVTLYTVTSNDSNGTAVISGATNFRTAILTTDSSAAGDDVDLWTSAFAWTRGGNPATADKFNGVQSIFYETYFAAGATTDIEVFFGLVQNQAGLAALPTTARHMGIFADISADPNYFFTSADGTTQTTTDSGQAVTTGVFRMRINITGNNDATIELATGAGAVIATKTVTALGGGDDFCWAPHWFVQTEAAAAKDANIFGWRVLPT